MVNKIPLDVIYGTLLGDGCIMRDRTSYRLDMSHSTKQLKYLLWKSSLLGCDKKPERYTTGYGGEGCRIRYYNKPVLERIYNTCIVNGKKQVRQEWLASCTTRSLAIWYQDDGSWSRAGQRVDGQRCQRQIHFSTCDFDMESNNLLCSWLKSMGYTSSIRIAKGYPYITIYTNSAVMKFWNDVAPHIVLKHKLDWGIRPAFFKCECGRFSSSRNKVKKCDICVYGESIGGCVSKHLMYCRFGTMSVDKLRKIGAPTYEEPMIWWFDHSLSPLNFDVHGVLF